MSLIIISWVNNLIIIYQKQTNNLIKTETIHKTDDDFTSIFIIRVNNIEIRA